MSDWYNQQKYLKIYPGRGLVVTLSLANLMQIVKESLKSKLCMD